MTMLAALLAVTLSLPDSAAMLAALRRGAAPSCPNLEARVHKLASEHLGVPPARVRPTARLREDLGADDTDVLEVEMAIEEEFDVPKSTSSDGASVTIDDLVAVARRHCRS